MIKTVRDERDQIASFHWSGDLTVKHDNGSSAI